MIKMKRKYFDENKLSMMFKIHELRYFIYFSTCAPYAERKHLVYMLHIYAWNIAIHQYSILPRKFCTAKYVLCPNEPTHKSYICTSSSTWGRFICYITTTTTCWHSDLSPHDGRLHVGALKISHRWFSTALHHYVDVIMGAMTSQITSLAIVYSTVYSGADQRKHQSSASLVFVRGIRRWLLAQKASNAENVFIWWRHNEDTRIPVYIIHHNCHIAINCWNTMWVLK